MFDEVEDLIDCLENIHNDEFYELFDSKIHFCGLRHSEILRNLLIMK